MAGAREIRLGIDSFEELTRQFNIEIVKTGNYTPVHNMPLKYEEGDTYLFKLPFADTVNTPSPIVESGLYLFLEDEWRKLT